MPDYATDYTVDELMIATIARRWTDESHVINGEVSFIPVSSFMLARLTHAPLLTWLAGAVGIDPRPVKLAVSTLEFPLWANSSGYLSQFEDFWSYTMKGRLFDTFCVRGAQIDQFGNCNLTLIGDKNRPTIKLPGSAALGDMGAMDKHIIIWSTTHNPRTFVPRVDFRSFVGWADGWDSRARLGLKNGPAMVVTNLAVMDFEPVTKRMRLQSVHPGVTAAEVRAATGFDLVIPAEVPETEPPTAEHVRLLRTVIDPDNVRKKEFR